jgi:hypothetical protein
MSKSMEIYQDTSEAGTTKTLSKITPPQEAFMYPMFFTAMSGFGAFSFNAIINNQDPFGVMASMLAVMSVVGYGGFKAIAFAHIKDNLEDSVFSLRTGMYTQPRITSVRRTKTEKRMVITEDAESKIHSDTKVTLALVTNRKGIWLEETAKISPMKSWDKVLDSVIKVHRLENIDALASVTIPEVSPDGSRVSWKDKVGNLLSGVGLLQECKRHDCATNCRHIF